METISKFNFKGKKALVRVDFNVPLSEGFKITDDTRIRAAVPTLRKILSDGGSAVLMSHLGRPKNGREERFSLRHLVSRVSELAGATVRFAEDCIGEKAEAVVRSLGQGEIVLLENLRFHKEEEAGDEAFSRKLASLGDVYVNDAFGTAHRAHASTAIIARFFPKDRLFGWLMAGEIQNLQKVMKGGERPVTAIIGGAKVSSKMAVLQNLLDKADHMLIGGGMAYTFIRALGGKTGASLVEADMIASALEIMHRAKEQKVHLYLPTDTVIADRFENNASCKTCLINEVSDGWMGLDIGPETEKTYREVILSSRTILWNGPMGVFEMPSFERGTQIVALAVAEATEKKGAYSLVGGGDSVAAVNKFGLSSRVSYVSTGGGAMLEYLEGRPLPGITAITG